jgi:HEAT repeat protein
MPMGPGERIEEIAATGTVRDVGDLAAELGQDDWPRAIAALESVLGRAAPRDLIWLEANRRILYDRYRLYSSAWNVLAPPAVAAFPLVAQKLASFHGNGHVREAAVVALAGESAPDVLPFLLFRANDWVLPVSMRARSALVNRLNASNVDAWVKMLPYEAHVRGLRRRDVAVLFDEAHGLILHPDNRACLTRAIQDPSSHVRRSFVLILQSLPENEQGAWLSVAMQDRDPVVAARAAVAFFQRSETSQEPDFVQTLTRHRVARVRALALSALWKQSTASAVDRTTELLFDPVRSVREVAQFELRRGSSIDPLKVYESALASPEKHDLSVVIAGLAEVGSRLHAPAIAPFVDSPRVDVRYAALAALAKLDGDGYVNVFLEVLHGNRPRLIRIASAALRNRAHLIGREKLEEMIIDGGSPAKTALRLLPRIDYWVALLAALTAATDPTLVGTANVVVARLIARQSYSRPPNRAQLERALTAARPHLQLAGAVEHLLLASSS